MRRKTSCLCLGNCVGLPGRQYGAPNGCDWPVPAVPWFRQDSEASSTSSVVSSLLFFSETGTLAWYSRRVGRRNRDRFHNSHFISFLFYFFFFFAFHGNREETKFIFIGPSTGCKTNKDCFCFAWREPFKTFEPGSNTNTKKRCSLVFILLLSLYTIIDYYLDFMEIGN